MDSAAERADKLAHPKMRVTAADAPSDADTSPLRAGLVVGQSSEAEIKSAIRTKIDMAASAAEIKKESLIDMEPKWKDGDRVRVLRSAAGGWEAGCVKVVVEGVPLTAKLDASGETVGLSGYPWEAVVKLTNEEEREAVKKAADRKAKAEAAARAKVAKEK